jgi:glycerol kinase
MNGFARGLWKSFEDVKGFRKVTEIYQPQPNEQKKALYEGWRNAVNQLIK